MADPHVSEVEWRETFEGFEITGVAIRDRDTIQTLARKAVTAEEGSHLLDGQIPTRIASIFLDDPTEDNIGFREINGLTHPRLGVSRAPFHEGVLVASMDRDGDTYAAGGGVDGHWEKIDASGWPGLQRLRCIGDQTFAVALGRLLYRRTGLGKWERIEGIAMSTRETDLQAAGFNDLDGFSENDLYAVGGHGDIWHFDGNTWRQIAFPSTEQLATVTCAADGKVYVTGEGGSLWVGQESTWKLLEKRESSVFWNDVRWFNGQLWLASDYQLRVWNGKEIVPPEHDSKTILASGHMDAHDGLLAVADLWSVSTFDGKDWRRIVAPFNDRFR